MKSVSNAYELGMRGLLRDRSYVRIIFGNADTTTATDGEWISNEELPFSEFETVGYPYQYGSPYAILELNGWTLDGRTLIFPGSGTVQDGFASNHMSDTEGAFSTPAVITRQFSTPHTSSGLTLTFDTRYQKWPSQITARFCLGNALVGTQIVPITGIETVVNTGAAQIDRMTITFDMTLPYRRPRLEEALYGLNKQLVSRNIISTQQKRDVDPLSRRLPAGTMEFAIINYEYNYDPDNPVGIYTYADKNSPIEIQFGYKLPSGSVGWIKSDKYVLNGKPTTKGNQTTFTGTGPIGSLTETFYKSKLGSKSLFTMVEEVLLNADLALTGQGARLWGIDENLRQVFTTAVPPIDTHMDCLQLIVHAARCRLFTNDDSIIRIKPFGMTVASIYSGRQADSGHLQYNEWGTMDRGNANGNTYAVFELNRWALGGGNQVIIPDDNPNERGYINEAMTNVEGTFTTAPVFTRTFNVSHDLPVVIIRFDTPMDEYPASIQMKYYKDTVLLDAQTAPVSSIEVFVSSFLAVDCTKIEVSFLNELPCRRMRVSKVHYWETDFTLDFSSTAENSQAISRIDELKAVTVARYSYAASDSTANLYEGTTTETELHVEFSGLVQDIQINVSGGALVFSNIYTKTANLVLSSGIKTMTITGRTLRRNSVVVSYPIALTGKMDKEENPLIINDSMCPTLANHMKNYPQIRSTYDTDYRGNPEIEVDNVIGLQTRYTDEMDALILVDEVSFNGSLNGKMKVRGLI